MVKGWICWLFNYLEKEGRKKQDKKSIKIISVWLWHIQRLTSLFPPSALPVFSPFPPSLPPWTHLFLPSLLPVLISLGINLSSFSYDCCMLLFPIKNFPIFSLTTVLLDVVSYSRAPQSTFQCSVRWFQAFFCLAWLGGADTQKFTQLVSLSIFFLDWQIAFSSLP